MPRRLSRRQFGLSTLALSSSLLAGRAGAANRLPMKAVVPGTGVPVARTGDDFEAEDWDYYPQHPKSSFNIDKEIRAPGGISKNLQWVEAAKRGQPDVVRRVSTPPGGIEGSSGALLLQSLNSGVPGRRSHEQQQDDLLSNSEQLAGRTIPVSWSPNCVCRVYVVPHTKWEERNGASFGYRIGVVGWGKEDNEEYWPGMFFHMERGLKDNKRTYSIRAWVRADGYGRDLPSLTFQADSWITMGMSCTADGACHFFLRPGIEDLQEKDCVGSYWPYNYRAHSFQCFFFNVINTDDGRNVGTPWIIDDAMLYCATPPASRIVGPQTATQPQRPTTTK
ncbi:MAG: hypothetical protein L0211_06100 [Planctomycetaceae bacterium]|nr:hypothetical protein [Planctomycetaceae bacterium]